MSSIAGLRFASPITVTSNEDVIARDTAGLGRSVVSSGLQRWELSIGLEWVLGEDARLHDLEHRLYGAQQAPFLLDTPIPNRENHVGLLAGQSIRIGLASISSGQMYLKFVGGTGTFYIPAGSFLYLPNAQKAYRTVSNVNVGTTAQAVTVTPKNLPMLSVDMPVILHRMRVVLNGDVSIQYAPDGLTRYVLNLIEAL